MYMYMAECGSTSECSYAGIRGVTTPIKGNPVMIGFS